MQKGVRRGWFLKWCLVASGQDLRKAVTLGFSQEWWKEIYFLATLQYATFTRRTFDFG